MQCYPSLRMLFPTFLCFSGSWRHFHETLETLVVIGIWLVSTVSIFLTRLVDARVQQSGSVSMDPGTTRLGTQQRWRWRL